MVGELFVLNRQNTMIHFDGEQTLIKNYFKEVSVQTSSVEYQLFINILNATENVVSVEHMCAHVSGDNTDILKALKTLHKMGSVLLYPGTWTIEQYLSQGWFPVLLQYMPPENDIREACRKLNDAQLFITPEADNILPGLKEALTRQALQVSHEQDTQTWIIGTVADTNKTIELIPESDRLIGINHQLAPPNIQPGSEDGYEYADASSVLFKVAPFYATIYIIKSIAGIGQSTFYLNRDGKFHEYDLKQQNYAQTIKELSFSEPSDQKDILTLVGRFEDFISKETSIPIKIPGWKDDVYSTIYQMGYATYSLSSTEKDADTFVYAGTDYVETAFQAMKEGLAYYLDAAVERQKWLVTSSEDYFVDKALFLLNHVDEPYTIYKVDPSAEEIQEIYEYIRFLEMDIHFYVKRYMHSKSCEVYIYDGVSDMIFTDGKRTIDVKRKLSKLLPNYMLVVCNSDIAPVTVLGEVNDETLRNELLHSKVEKADVAMPDSETAFIHNSLDIFKRENLDYFESAWVHERQMNQANLVVRKLEVDANR